jgi:hypothetical protein
MHMLNCAHTHMHTHSLAQWLREQTKIALAAANEVLGPSSTACAARASLCNFSNVLSVEEEASASRVSCSACTCCRCDKATEDATAPVVHASSASSPSSAAFKSSLTAWPEGGTTRAQG